MEILKGLLMAWLVIGGMLFLVFLIDYLAFTAGENSWFFIEKERKEKKKVNFKKNNK